MSRTAIVTGGASGMGRATVDLLERRGVTVAVFDLDGAPAVDVSDADAVDAAVARVRRDLGPVDIVVNAAGIGVGGTLGDDGYRDAWDAALAVNVTGAMNVVRACLPDLLDSGTGRVVNVASTEALAAARRTGPYSVSKHALVGFTRSLAVDHGRSGLTANAVCPGAVLTPMTEHYPAASRDEFARRRIPVGRYADPVEVAFVIAMLTDIEASFVNGATIVVDGGMTAQA